MQEVLKHTPVKYQTAVRWRVDAYRRDLGPSGWALAQGLTYVSSHNMSSANRDAWASKTLESALEALEV